MREVAFDLEQGIIKPDVETIIDRRHVFVAGLARSGTTILMRLLHGHVGLHSLTYQDMPFVLMPSLWRKLSAGSRKIGAEKMRAHEDGLLVNNDSPEALEEVFWLTFSRQAYLSKDYLLPMDADEQLVEQFRNYIAAVLHSTETERYLSKNNNNLLRLASLQRAFPKCQIIIPYRHPLQQAASLSKQHKHFLLLQEQDPFILRYMTWLGHHEFGYDHRRFQFENQESRFADPDSLDYWLEMWVQCYSHLLRTAPEGSLFVGYESLIENQARLWPSLCNTLDIHGNQEGAEALRLPGLHIVEGVDSALVDKAQAIHQRLATRMRAWCK